MSNPRPLVLLTFLACVRAWAQSDSLLEAVRVQRSGASPQCEQELKACLEGACAQADRLSLLCGYLLLSDSRAAHAVEQLSSRESPPGLEPFHAWYLGEAYAWSQQAEQALKVWAAARPKAPDWLKARIDARSGELWLERGDAKRARPLLEAAAATDPSPELLYRRGIARWMTQDTAKGQADLRAVAVRFPLHVYGVRAQELLSPTYTFDEHLTRAAALGGSRAVQELEPLTAPKGREGQWELALAHAHFQTGDEAKGQALLASAARRTAGVASEALMAMARRAMKNNDNAAARKLMLQLDQSYPDQPAAEDAGYLAAWLAMQGGEFEAAAADFTTFDTRHPNSKKRDEARWFKAYSEYRAGKCSTATLQSLIDEFPKSSLVPQATYWQAVCELKQAPAPRSKALTRRLAERWRGLILSAPGSFYAVLAAERLRELGESPPAPFAVAPKTLSAVPPKQLRLAQALAATGLFRDAGREVDRVVGTVRTSGEALQLGHVLQQLGEYGAAYTLALRWLWGAVFTQKDPAAIALLYPKAFEESVSRQSSAHGLDPHLAWAIMRQESAFRPEVTSVADARGLMQLIPPTANSIAKMRQEEPIDPAELYAPEQSISMGTWLLAALLDRFGHPSLCAAAYNAGAAPVAKWANTRSDLPFDEWVEAIPWKETRGYVKNVTANYFVYRALYAPGGDPLRLSMKVPVPKATGVDF